jgi:hypothetical protein
MTKMLRSKVNGVIFEWNELLLKNPNIEVITEEEAYPERRAPVNLAERKPAVDVTVPKEAVVPPPEVAPELLAEASKPFGTNNTRVDTKPNKRKKQEAPLFDVVGLIGEF